MKQTILIICLFLAGTFLLIYFVAQPAFIKDFNLTETGAIGDSIGGITAPLLGLISILLLYKTLKMQIDANKDQRIRIEADLLLSLISQLENELSTFYYTKQEIDVEARTIVYRYPGVEGLNKFVDETCYSHGGKIRTDINGFTFKDLFQAKQILLLIRSFQLVKDRIGMSKLPADIEHVINEKLFSFYECRLEYAIRSLTELFRHNNNLRDECSFVVETFFENNDAFLQYLYGEYDPKTDTGNFV